MAWFHVKLADGYSRNVNVDGDAQMAMRHVYLEACEPIWCCIHEEIADSSTAPVGEMGFFYPTPSQPVSAVPMRGVYVGGGYSLIPA